MKKMKKRRDSMGLNRPSMKMLGAAALSLSLAGGVAAATAGTALAAKAKPKPKPAAAKTKTTPAAKKKATPAHAAAGVVKAFDAKTDVLTVMVGTHEDTFLTSAAKVTDLGKSASVAALKAGEHVRVTYTGTGTRDLHATAVAILKA
jgi:hypothetical protein